MKLGGCERDTGKGTVLVMVSSFRIFHAFIVFRHASISLWLSVVCVQLLSAMGTF